MGRTQTVYVDVRKLLDCGSSGSTILRMMLAANDIALANVCLRQYKSPEFPCPSYVRRGALMYFVRLQCGHLHEALNAVAEIKHDPMLSALVTRLHPEFQSLFQELIRFVDDGPDRKKYEQIIGRIRHQTIFHYDEQMVLKGLEILAQSERRISSITRGDDISLWRFVVGDDVLDVLTVNEFWKAKGEEELNEAVDFAADLCKRFLDFCGEFAYLFVIENARAV